MFDLRKIERGAEMARDKVAEAGGELMYLTLTGSLIHGTATENSDVDIKGVYLPARDIVLMGEKPKVISFSTSGKDRKNTAGDIDISILPIQDFLKGVLKMEGNALEILFSLRGGDHVVYESPDPVLRNAIESVFENRRMLLSANTRALTGFARGIARRYVDRGIRLREAKTVLDVLQGFDPKSKLQEHRREIEALCSDKKNYKIGIGEGSNGASMEYFFMDVRQVGMSSPVYKAIEVLEAIIDTFGKRSGVAAEKGADWKAYSHAVRGYRTSIDLLKMGEIYYPLPYAEELLEIKNGKWSVEKVEKLLDALSAEVRELEEKGNGVLRGEPDRRFVLKIIESLYCER